MSLKYRLSCLTLVLLMIGIYACKSNEPKENNESLGFSNDSDSTLIVHQNLKSSHYNYPSAKEMFVFIQKDNKLTFKSKLLNPTSNQSKYVDSRSKLLNLGVYISDLTYMTVFKQSKNTDLYFETIYTLSDQLRISIPYSENLLNRIKDNIANRDSVINYYENYSDDFFNYLNKNNKEHILSVITTGSYIEGLYILVNLIDDFSGNSEIIQKIADQKYTFENLYRNLEEYKSDPNAATALQYLEQILALYNELDVIKEPVQTTRDKNNQLVIDGGEKLLFNQEQFNQFKSLINDQRKSIVLNQNVYNEQ